MKGMMFTEFIEWVERTWPPEVADDMIDASKLDGAYTAVGTYDHVELIQLVTVLAERVNEPAPDLVKRFGRGIFSTLVKGHPQMMVDTPTSFALLQKLEAHIHPEVRKLYPGAEVPTFDAQAAGAGLSLTYRSSRPFADLAEGLIQGCGDWFGDTLTIQRTEASDGSTVFSIQRSTSG